MINDWQIGGFGLYIHWPFCEAKCPYCDFNSHVERHIDQDRWLSAFLTRLEQAAEQTPDRVLNSVYFGGGTPSLMEPRLVGGILDKVSDLWTPANDIEITLEANPSSVEVDRFVGYRTAGVNRVSLGVQALNDQDLKRLGRIHSADEAKHAIQISQSVFDRTSYDLIYARQSQTLADWEAELKHALTLQAGHLSLYQLTIEQGTAFGDRYNAGKLRGLPDDGVATDMFELTQSLCSDAGLPAYEISNHATIGNESRHNQIYWRYGDYVGIGPGAHGRLSVSGQKTATVEISNPGMWLERVEAGKVYRSTPLTPQDIAVEYTMMGLRLREPLDLERLTRLTGLEIHEETLNSLVDIGVITRGRNTIIATDQGRPLLNSIISKLVDEFL